MWILNHTAARKFELPMLRKMGYEVFTPKSYPNDPNFRSASVDLRCDDSLSIPADELAILNSADWYAGADRKAWEVANKYFDIAFCILFDPRGVEKTCRQFQGEILWRTYGLTDPYTYSKALQGHPQYRRVNSAFRQLGPRFWFAEAYPNLHDIEDGWIRRQAVYLPLGMAGANEPAQQEWVGGDHRVLFVCPDIGFNQAYIEIYAEFKSHFKDIPYAVGGAQSIKLDDPHILGYLPLDEHQRNMTHMQCMFYHSQSPRHIHYHPFEAIKIGMPLVFMGGGMLDRMGGTNLPGRARTWGEATQKAKRLLAGDERLAQDIRSSQNILLHEMTEEFAKPYWIKGLAQIEDALSSRDPTPAPQAKKRLAILSPRRSLPLALKLAERLREEAETSGVVHTEIVIGLETSRKKPWDDVADDEVVSIGFPARIFSWKEMSKAAAERALLYAGVGRELESATFLAPDDQIHFFQDCDLWLLIGGRTEYPILPLKPIVVVVDGYQNKYERPLRHNGPRAARLGQLPSPDAIVVREPHTRSLLVNMEALNPKSIHVSDVETSSNSILDVVLECL